MVSGECCMPGRGILTFCCMGGKLWRYRSGYPPLPGGCHACVMLPAKPGPGGQWPGSFFYIPLRNQRSFYPCTRRKRPPAVGGRGGMPGRGAFAGASTPGPGVLPGCGPPHGGNAWTGPRSPPAPGRLPWEAAPPGTVRGREKQKTLFLPEKAFQ